MKMVAVLPVFNHGSAVGDVVAGLRAQGLPVILVDDGSDRETAQILDALAASEAMSMPPIKLARHPENRGKGAAVMTGFCVARDWGASHVLQVDSDGQHDLAAVPDFLAAAGEHPAAVILGYPQYDASVPKSRLYSRYLTHVWVWINTLSLSIKDSMCGFRIYPLAPVLPLLPALSHTTRMDFDVEIVVRLAWAGVPIFNRPVGVRYPPGGVSHFHVWRDNLRISLMHARLFAGMLIRLPRLLKRLCSGNP